MDIQTLSARYQVRRLVEADVDAILPLCAGNPLFYRYHPPMSTRESVLADMAALPPGTREEDKHYLGYFEDDMLVAVLDLILGYPAEDAAYLGFFMLRAEKQGKGVGSAMIAELADALGGQGVRVLHLAIDRGNPQSEAFWTKNGFAVVDKGSSGKDSPFVPMTRRL